MAEMLAFATIAGLLSWIVLSIAVGMFASNHRGRSGGVWFFLSLLFSPLLAGAFIAALPRLGEEGIPSFDERGLTEEDRQRYNRLTPAAQRSYRQHSLQIEGLRAKMERAEKRGDMKSAAYWQEKIAALRREVKGEHPR